MKKTNINQKTYYSLDTFFTLKKQKELADISILNLFTL